MKGNKMTILHEWMDMSTNMLIFHAIYAKLSEVKDPSWHAAM